MHMFALCSNKSIKVWPSPLRSTARRPRPIAPCSGFKMVSGNFPRFNECQWYCCSSASEVQHSSKDAANLVKLSTEFCPVLSHVALHYADLPHEPGRRQPQPAALESPACHEDQKRPKNHFGSTHMVLAKIGI